MRCRGEYLHFRCDKHKVDGWDACGSSHEYRCGVSGCDRPAKSYWYRGAKFETLAAQVEVSRTFDCLDTWLP